MGGGGAAATIAGAGEATVVGIGAKAAGFYALVNATTGLTMMGGVGGAPAAGTAGIRGAIGTAATVASAHVTIIVGNAVAVGASALEVGCYFQDEHITEYAEVNAIARDIAVTAPADLYQYIPDYNAEHNDTIIVMDPDSEDVRDDTYRVEDLYIVNGILKKQRLGVEYCYWSCRLWRESD